MSGPRRSGGDGPGGLTAAELDAFLARLSPDRDEAGVLYENLRRRLLRLFELRFCEDPEALVDEAIDRVARRLPGLEIKSSELAFARGVAHHVAQEMLRQRQRERRAFLVAAALAASAPEPELDSARRRCLEACLEELPGDQHRLILEYHQGENRIRHRQGLARELGLSPNALRIRAYRIRRDLEDCCARCLAARQAEPRRPGRRSE
jgi:RNA polymerase sigma factor (sigma-70 family)